MSRLVYLMPMWGSSTRNYIRKAQTLWNKTARWTSGLRRRTRTTKLMKYNDWLSVQEMITLHTTVLMWKTIHMRKPKHIYDKLTVLDDLKIEEQEPRLQLTKRSYRHRAILHWNELTTEMRENDSIAGFKRSLKSWIKNKRSPEPD